MKMKKIVYLIMLMASMAWSATGAAAPIVVVDCEALDFGDGYNGYHEYRTLTLTGSDLTGDVTLSLAGSNAFHYSIVGDQVITSEQAEQGAEVTVSFFPYSTGQLGASLIISTPGIDDITISLSGNGIKTV